MGRVVRLLAAGVLGPGQPTMYQLAEGRKHSQEAQETVGKLGLLP